MISTELISGVILSGGRGSRMGHVDKGLQVLQDKPMVQHVIDALSPQVQQIIINANQNITIYEEFGFPVVCDLNSDFAGPLAGIQAGLNVCTTSYLVTTPCDSPFLAKDLVARLATNLIAEHADIALACTIETKIIDGIEVKYKQKHPVFMLMKASLKASLAEFLNQGGRKVEHWLNTLPTVEVVFDDNSAFQNINTLEELNLHQQL